jgi:hypothetical protein
MKHYSKKQEKSNKSTKKIENSDIPEVTKTNKKVTGSTPKTELSKNSPASQLRTLYNSFSMSDFTQEKLDLEKRMYEEEKKKYTGKNKNFLSSLPLDNPLIIILQGIHRNLLHQWITKMIPVGGNKKSDSTIISNWRKLRVKSFDEVLRLGTDGCWNVLWDFTNLDSGLNQCFPEMMDVETVNGSVIDCLLEENRNRFLYGYESKILNNPRLEVTEKNIYSLFKQMCRISTGTQPVVNFPTMVGIWIISDSYFHTLSVYNGVPNDHFVVLDPCSGWGSRLLGTLCVFHRLKEDYFYRYGKQLHVSYLSTDPNTLVHDRFENIVLDWFETVEPEITHKYFHFDKEVLGCETTEFLDYCKTVLKNFGLKSVNVSFTSPPYFNREKYSKDKSQSYLMYPTYPLWRIKFLKGMIDNVHELLLPGGRFYLNISNTLEPDGRINPMESDSVTFFRECGMKEVKTYKMMLSGSSKSDHMVSVGFPEIDPELSPEHKYEPVFVYEKSK